MKAGEVVLIRLTQFGGGAQKLRPALLLAALPGPKTRGQARKVPKVKLNRNEFGKRRLGESGKVQDRLHSAAISHREGHDLGGAGGNLRSAGEQCGELAGSPGEAPRASLVRPFLCRESRDGGRGRRAAERATRQKPRWVSGPLMRF
jgi:hypothetical protein